MGQAALDPVPDEAARNESHQVNYCHDDIGREAQKARYEAMKEGPNRQPCGKCNKPVKAEYCFCHICGKILCEVHFIEHLTSNVPLGNWRKSCAPLDQIPGLIVRGDGSGLIGGLGYENPGEEIQTWKDPFVIWQEHGGQYVAKIGLPRDGQVGKMSPPGTIDEAVAFVVKEYTMHIAQTIKLARNYVKEEPSHGHRPDPEIKTVPLEELKPSKSAVLPSRGVGMITISAYHEGKLLLTWKAPCVPREGDRLFVNAKTYFVSSVLWAISSGDPNEARVGEVTLVVQ
jgi:hypothetical protein